MMSHTSVQPQTSSTLIAIPQTLHEYFAPFLILPADAFFLTGFFAFFSAMLELPPLLKIYLFSTCTMAIAYPTGWIIIKVIL